MQTDVADHIGSIFFLFIVLALIWLSNSGRLYAAIVAIRTATGPATVPATSIPPTASTNTSPTVAKDINGNPILINGQPFTYTPDPNITPLPLPQ